MVGGLIMCHGDDAGLRVPPRLAPTQVVVLLVKDDAGAGAAAEALLGELKGLGVRVELDARADISFGRRSVDWELKGVPVRLEVGPRDVAEGVVTLVRRDLSTKQTVPLPGAAKEAADLLEQIQADMLASATAERDARIHDVATPAEAVEASADGWGRMRWAELCADDGEARLREHGITVRCLQAGDGGLPSGEDDPDAIAFVGRAY
jgi:prolyl-tRNA synthetase